jgi:uncharacterized protein (DUF427 family)
MSNNFTITPSESTWVVRADGAELAQTDHALELREGDAPAVIYFPREDVAMAFLDPAPTFSSSRQKGRTRRYRLVGPDRKIEDAAWSFEDPKPALARLAGHVAFDVDRVTLERY